MPFRARIALVMMWLASLFAVATLARGQAHQLNPLPKPIVVSGSDIGYRVEGLLRGAPAGTLVIRWNGKWVEPQVARGHLRPVR
jgi:hypothetical protein